MRSRPAEGWDRTGVGGRGGAGTIWHMDPRPAPDPKKLLSQWMEWETGQTPPGRVMSNLKTGGLRELLEQLSGQAAGEG